MAIVEVLLLVLGGALVAEGLLYALFPDQARRMVELVSQIGPEQLRIAGITALAVGVLVFWLARQVGGG
ncbi:MAG: DUF2065 domain-containing protein [Pseudomonadota bacterium]